MMNYRWGGYLLIALALINLRYQTGQQNVFVHSLIIFIPGALILLATVIPSTKKLLEQKVVKMLAIVIGIAFIGYSLLN